MLTPSVKPPFASMGISFRCRLNVPPPPDSQSGMVTPPPTMELIPRIAPLITPITALMGTLHSSTSAEKALPKIDFTPSHALAQFPVNTPVINWINPSNTPWMLVITFPMFCAICAIAARIGGPTVLTTLRITIMMLSMTGSTACMALPIMFATFITAVPMLVMIGPICGAMALKAFSNPGSSVVLTHPNTCSNIGFTVCVPKFTICWNTPITLCPMLTMLSKPVPAFSPNIPTIAVRTLAIFSGLKTPTILSFMPVIVFKNPSNTATPCSPNTFPMMPRISSRCSPSKLTAATMDPITATTGSAAEAIPPNALTNGIAPVASVFTPPIALLAIPPAPCKICIPASFSGFPATRCAAVAPPRSLLMTVPSRPMSLNGACAAVMAVPGVVSAVGAAATSAVVVAGSAGLIMLLIKLFTPFAPAIAPSAMPFDKSHCESAKSFAFPNRLLAQLAAPVAAVPTAFPAFVSVARFSASFASTPAVLLPFSSAS